MNFKCVKISTTVPKDGADAVRNALGKTGAGVVGNYTFCSFSLIGTGRFIPNEQSNPHIGSANTLEMVEEEKIEVVCQRAIAKQVVAALKKAHPYEEPIIDIMPLINEEDL